MTPSFLLLLFASAAPGPAITGPAPEQPPGVVAQGRSVAGLYRVRGSPDSVTRLMLHEDGRFDFLLIAGALDARASGRWLADGPFLVLNTEPRPVPPAFSAGPVGRDPERPLTLSMHWPGGRGIAGVDFRLGLADGRVIEDYTQEEGWSPDAAAGSIEPRWIEWSLSMFNVPPVRFALDPAAGNLFPFVLTPNDLGVIDFRDWTLAVTASGLEPRDQSGDVFVREEEEEAHEDVEDVEAEVEAGEE